LIRKRKFSGELLTGHKGAAVEVPFDPERVWKIAPGPLWPGRRGHAVRATLGKVQFSSCIVPRSSRFFLLIAPEVQRESGVRPGDVIEISVEPLAPGGDGSRGQRA
jgi:hypothetical protein